MSAAFRFDQYKVAKLRYEPNLDEKKEKEASYNFTITNTVSVSNDDKHKYRCDLIVEVSGSALAEVVLYGYFKAEKFYSDDEYERESSEVGPISVSILLPIARSILASLSCQDGARPIMIPVTNINEMQEINSIGE